MPTNYITEFAHNGQTYLEKNAAVAQSILSCLNEIRELGRDCIIFAEASLQAALEGATNSGEHPEERLALLTKAILEFSLALPIDAPAPGSFSPQAIQGLVKLPATFLEHARKYEAFTPEIRENFLVACFNGKVTDKTVGYREYPMKMAMLGADLNYLISYHNSKLGDDAPAYLYLSSVGDAPADEAFVAGDATHHTDAS